MKFKTNVENKKSSTPIIYLDMKKTRGWLIILMITLSIFTVAACGDKNDKGEKVEQVSYFDIVLYGKPAINLQQYLIKGKQVGIEGELRQDRWTKDNQSFSRVYIVASNVMLLGGNSNSQQTQEVTHTQPTPLPAETQEVFMPDFVDDIQIF